MHAPHRKFPTLASLSASQIAAIRTIPPHGQAAVHTTEARRPVGIFIAPDHYARERAEVFRKVPVAVTLSSMLPEPKMFLALDAYDLPILLSRGEDGQVKAFLNACQHKGAKVVERADAFKGGRVSCPYHAWTYNLAGELAGVPRQEVFPSLDKHEHGLAPLACHEAGGFIWVMLDREAEPDFSAITPNWWAISTPWACPMRTCSATSDSRSMPTGSWSSSLSSRATTCRGCTRLPLAACLPMSPPS
ncbi:aromatic ring-hydroxylating oxygenase subunit alpha [Massilia cavernae]|uniref:Rieske (2Fe-2S) protein n=1 Tax=Massilia cavernae TaxID=2320864 RepID=A0A418Y0T1_9BURK|nr:Rieske (2Fe-2S) protein [Massilia cavernae]RJG18853.1 Rieske (2Fe-2S) protein [Massilia cavernae]